MKKLLLILSICFFILGITACSTDSNKNKQDYVGPETISLQVGDRYKIENVGKDVEVVVEDTEASNHLAYVREVKVTPTSYGGGTEGFNIPFNVEFDGGWIKGTVTAESIKAGSPVFTEEL